MAGHSKSKTIMHRKNAQDAKKAIAFTKMSREISMAVREGGADPEFNPRLRAVLVKARLVGLPKDKIQKALNPAQHDQDETIRYQAYGPGGVGLIIECLTNNKNRTASEIRAILARHKAKIQTTEHLFDHLGRIKFDISNLDRVLEMASSDNLNIEQTLIDTRSYDDHGRDDDEYVSLFFTRENFSRAQTLIKNLQIDPVCEDMYWFPKLVQPLSAKDQERLSSLTESLEEHNDVHDIYSNADKSCEHKH